MSDLRSIIVADELDRGRQLWDAYASQASTPLALPLFATLDGFLALEEGAATVLVDPGVLTPSNQGKIRAHAERLVAASKPTPPPKLIKIA